MNGFLTLKTNIPKEIKESRDHWACSRGQFQSSSLQGKPPPETEQAYRHSMTCEMTARSYAASATGVPMRPSSASFSLFIVSGRASLGSEERFSTMVVSSEFLVRAASSKRCQYVFVTRMTHHYKTTRLTRFRLLGRGAVKADSEADNHKENLLEDAHA